MVSSLFILVDIGNVMGFIVEHIIKGNLVRKLPSYRQVSWLAINHIMPATHHQILGKCNSSGAREFTGESILGRKAYFFSGNVAPGVAEVNLSGCGPRSGKVVDKKCTGL